MKSVLDGQRHTVGRPRVRAGRRWVGLIAIVAMALVTMERRGRADESELVLIVNARNKEDPDMFKLKQLYMGEASFWSDNVRVTPFVRPNDAPASAAFFLAIHVTPWRFRRLWQEKQLSGQGTAPEVVEAVEMLIAKVAADPGAIGFANRNELRSAAPRVRMLPLR